MKVINHNESKIVCATFDELYIIEKALSYYLASNEKHLEGCPEESKFAEMLIRENKIADECLRAMSIYNQLY